MDEKWFDDDLIPSDAVIDHTVKQIGQGAASPIREIDRQVREVARGIVRINKPRWCLLEGEGRPLKSQDNNRYYLVRMGFQFYIPKESYEHGSRFIYSLCKARIWPKISHQPDPLVYEILPKDIYDGEPRKVSIQVSPEIKLGAFGGSLGEMDTDITIGQVTPAIVGWAGKDEREPYWELRPITKELSGTQHMWMVLEVPKDCQGVRLAIWVEAEVQTKFGLIYLGPKQKVWENRPSMIIE